MPKSSYEQSIRDFHKAFGITQNTTMDDIEALHLRKNLILEESEEVKTAFHNYIFDLMTDVGPEELQQRKVELAKELADLLYVTFGAFDIFDLDAQVIFNRVHMSNMSKLGPDNKPVYREDGKVMKGPNYKPPYLKDVV